MIDLSNARHIVLATHRRFDSHVLTRRDTGWEYGARTCLSETCLCVTHNTWQWQDCSEAEATEIVALFTSEGFVPQVTEF